MCVHPTLHRLKTGTTRGVGLCVRPDYTRTRCGG